MSTAKADPKHSKPTEGRPAIPGIMVVRKGPLVKAIRARLLDRTNWMQVAQA